MFYGLLKVHSNIENGVWRVVFVFLLWAISETGTFYRIWLFFMSGVDSSKYKHKDRQTIFKIFSPYLKERGGAKFFLPINLYEIVKIAILLSFQECLGNSF